MKFGDITKRLNEKQQFKEAKTNKNLEGLGTSATVLLTDDQLDSVAGGVAVKTKKLEDRVIK